MGGGATHAGCTLADMEAGESKCSGGGDGYTSSYSPSVTAGVLDVYASAPASAAGRLARLL